MTRDSKSGAASSTAGAPNAQSSAHIHGAQMAAGMTEMTKDNLAAAAESGKILRDGLQQLAESYAADSRAMFEMLSSDLRQLGATTSPMEFMRLQSEFMRRNCEAAFALGAKNGEAIQRLAQDASEPIAKQAQATMDKVHRRP